MESDQKQAYLPEALRRVQELIIVYGDRNPKRQRVLVKVREILKKSNCTHF